MGAYRDLRRRAPRPQYASEQFAGEQFNMLINGQGNLGGSMDTGGTVCSTASYGPKDNLPNVCTWLLTGHQ